MSTQQRLDRINKALDKLQRQYNTDTTRNVYRIGKRIRALEAEANKLSRQL